jgi:hypothetical protein
VLLYGSAWSWRIALYRVLGWGKQCFAVVSLPRRSRPLTVADAFSSAVASAATRRILSVMPDIHDFPKHDSTVAL